MRNLEEVLLNKQSMLEQQKKDMCDNKLKAWLEKNEKYLKNDDVSAKKSLLSSEIQSDKLILLKNYNDLIIKKFPDARLILEVIIRFILFFEKFLFYFKTEPITCGSLLKKENIDFGSSKSRTTGLFLFDLCYNLSYFVQ
jgi:hypothetical protein